MPDLTQALKDLVNAAQKLSDARAAEEAADKDEKAKVNEHKEASHKVTTPSLHKGDLDKAVQEEKAKDALVKAAQAKHKQAVADLRKAEELARR